MTARSPARLGGLIIAALLAAVPAVPAQAQRGGAFISLYDANNFRGMRLTLRNSTSSLNARGFNNRARSARVQGRWSLCDQANFRGRCITVRHNQSSLASIGMHGRVSSVRFLGW